MSRIEKSIIDSAVHPLTSIDSSGSSTTHSPATRKGISRKRIAEIIAILIALFVFLPLLYNVINNLVRPVASITDVQAYYDARPRDLGGELYRVRFELTDTYGHSTTSDGTLNITVTLDNAVLYEKAFTVNKSQFEKGGSWPRSWFWFYEVDFPASNVQELPSVLEDYARAGRKVKAVVYFTTPQGRTLTGADDVWDPRAWED